MSFTAMQLAYLVNGNPCRCSSCADLRRTAWFRRTFSRRCLVTLQYNTGSAALRLTLPFPQAPTGFCSSRHSAVHALASPTPPHHTHRPQHYLNTARQGLRRAALPVRSATARPRRHRTDSPRTGRSASGRTTLPPPPCASRRRILIILNLI